MWSVVLGLFDSPFCLFVMDRVRLILTRVHSTAASGWSCGGNIALEAAHILASSSLSSSSDPRHHRSDGHCGGGFEVAGLVLIDTGFPNFVDGDNNHKTNEEATAMLRTLDLPLSADIPRQSQRAMRRAMRAAREMLVRWRAPWWDGVVGEVQPPFLSYACASVVDPPCSSL